MSIKEGKNRALRGEVLVLLLGAVLTGCGGGGGGSPSPPPSGPGPAPAPVPPPPPAAVVPPLSATVVNLNDNHRIGALHWEEGSTAAGGQGQPVSGIDCLENMPDEYHVHTHLTIYLNGEALAVPQNIGIESGPPRCFYLIHTHDHSGKLHIEAAAPGTFTLGQFFAIWGETLNSTTLADLSGMPVVVYVTDDGVTELVEDNWSDIELTSHREITIQVGTEIAEIPQYSWTGN
jgi:hypothetical protein